MRWLVLCFFLLFLLGCTQEQEVETITNFPAPLTNINDAQLRASDNTLTIRFKNTGSDAIQVPFKSNFRVNEGSWCDDPQMIGEYNNRLIKEDMDIPSQAEFTLQWKCDEVLMLPGSTLDMVVSFDYRDVPTWLMRTHLGFVTAIYD